MENDSAMADELYKKVFGNDEFSARSSEKLLTTCGKRFQHKKTKQKGSFNDFAQGGGKIMMQCNSTKYVYNDDE